MGRTLNERQRLCPVHESVTKVRSGAWCRFHFKGRAGGSAAAPKHSWSPVFVLCLPKCLPVNNSPDSSWQDTIDSQDPHPLFSPKPAQTSQTSLSTVMTNPSDSSQPCPVRPQPAGSSRWRGVAREDICGLNNRHSVRTAGADRPGAPLLCSAPYICRWSLEEEGLNVFAPSSLRCQAVSSLHPKGA